MEFDLNNEMFEKTKELIQLRLSEILEEILKEIRNDLKEAYFIIIKILKKYVDLDEKYYHLIATWVLGTYFHKIFITYPYLFLNAMKGSGKTRTLKIISKLAWNGQVVVDISEAVLFRTASTATICIDELEDIKRKERNMLRLLLNSAYKKDIVVSRMSKINIKGMEKYFTQSFKLYTPVAMANISGMESVLADRCIEIILLKSNNKKITKILELFDFDEDIRRFKEIVEKYKELNNFVFLKEQLLKDFIKLFDKDISKEELLEIFKKFESEGIDLKGMLRNKFSELSSELSEERSIGVSELSERSALSASKKIYIYTFTYSLINYILSLYNSYILYNINSLNSLNSFKSLNTLSSLNIKDFYNNILNSDLEGRDLELSFPLLLTSLLVGNFKEFNKIIQEIMKQRKIEELTNQKQISFLEFLYNYQNKTEDYIYIKDLRDKFKEDSDIEVTGFWIGITLKHFGFVKEKRRMNKGVQVILDWKKVEEEYLKIKPFITKEEDNVENNSDEPKKEQIIIAEDVDNRFIQTNLYEALENFLDSFKDGDSFTIDKLIDFVRKSLNLINISKDVEDYVMDWIYTKITKDGRVIEEKPFIFRKLF